MGAVKGASNRGAPRGARAQRQPNFDHDARQRDERKSFKLALVANETTTLKANSFRGIQSTKVRNIESNTVVTMRSNTVSNTRGNIRSTTVGNAVSNRVSTDG